MPIKFGTNPDLHEVVLTFDDGPSPSLTPQLLDILAKHNIKAMFFVLGQLIGTPTGQNIIKRAFSEGHIIANHSFDHPNFQKLSLAKVKDQLKRTQDRIGACAHPMKFMRPPYGSTNKSIDNLIKTEGYTKLLWNVDSMDWDKHFKPTGWIDNAMKQINNRNDSIVLMHDIHKTTVGNVETLIKKIKAKAKTEIISYA
jgi:peptidoglycan/xylan/chitin deacetylase (PgdA/CDA1 family)